MLKYFRIDEFGIVFSTDDLSIIKELNLYTEGNKFLENIRQYSILTRHNSFDNVYEFKDLNSSIMNIENYKRTFYSNNPKAAPIHRGEYSIKGGKLIIKGFGQDFFRVREGLFEKIQDNLGRSYYTQIPTVIGNFNTISTIEVDTNVENIELDNLNKDHLEVKVNNLYSDSELKTINNEIDDCI